MGDRTYGVLYIAGSGRSGTTLLHLLLGQVEGFFAAGEVRYLWRELAKDRRCGCGSTIQGCATWSAILERAFGGVGIAEAQEIAGQVETFRITQLPRTWIPTLRDRELDRLGDLRDQLTRLYGAIVEVTGSEVIVDSSKNPAYGYLLAHTRLPKLTVLHVVRDAPATAFSWGQRRESEPGHRLRRRSPATAALEWDAHNLATELFLRGVAGSLQRIRYEDLVADPRVTLDDVLGRLGESSSGLTFPSENEVELAPRNHALFGNIVRFQHGRVTLRRDDRWRTQMSRKDRLTVASLTWPLRLRYGYPDVRSRSPAETSRVRSAARR